MIEKLLPGTVHIWSVWMTTLPWSAQTLWEVLSDNERRVANQYAFVHDQQAFVLRRGSLRMLLAWYLAKPPTTLQLISGPYGKPELLTAAGQASLCFNLSQSGNLALYAIAWQPVGVDVEQVTAEQDVAALAEYFFTPAECDWIATLPQDQQAQGALRLWTCKEAYVKAIGEGITAALKRLCVALDPHAARLLSIAGDTQAARCWSLQEFVPVPGYVAALAYRQVHSETMISVCSLTSILVAQGQGPEMSPSFLLPS